MTGGRDPDSHEIRRGAAAEGGAHKAGLTEITLTTFRDVPWNAPYYERLGYWVFEPEDGRSGLAAIRADDAESSFAVKHRVAMGRVLRSRT